MKRYEQNITLLLCLTPLNALALSGAYLTLFYELHGLVMASILALQTVFSTAGVLWEIPSGYLADRKGRALSIKLSVPIAAVGLMAYGLSSHFWQFVLCELALALARGMTSGIDTALLIDSLRACGRMDEYQKLAQRMQALTYLAIAIGVPLAYVLVRLYGPWATIFGDGVLSALAWPFALKLVEVPRSKCSSAQEAVARSAWHALGMMIQKAEVRQMLLLGVVLSGATYFGFWLSVPYYQSVGVSVGLFGLLLAVRSLFKAWLSHRFVQKHHVARNMYAYASLLLLVPLAMTTHALWLLWVVLGHDVVQALHVQPLTEALNEHMAEEYRATLNSVVTMTRRLAYSVIGPFVGLLVDRHGLNAGLLAVGVTCAGLAYVLLWRLRRHTVFAA